MLYYINKMVEQIKLKVTGSLNTIRRLPHFMYTFILRFLLNRVGNNSFFIYRSYMYAPHRIQIGKHCLVNRGCRLDGRGGISMGDYVMLGPGCSINSSSHKFDNTDIPILLQGLKYGGVIIEDDVWLGMNSVIMPGITVGSGAIVGANSVVTRNVPPFAIVGGNPARVLKFRKSSKKPGKHKRAIT